MSKTFEKRQSLLANAKFRHDAMRAQLELKPHVPSKVFEELNIVEEQFSRAADLIDTPDGEYEVDRAVSLHAVSMASNAFLGLQVRSGGWAGQATRSIKHEKWRDRACELLGPIKKPYPRGTKTAIADEIAKEFGVEFDTVRTRLRLMGVWGDTAP